MENKPPNKNDINSIFMNKNYSSSRIQFENEANYGTDVNEDVDSSFYEEKSEKKNQKTSHKDQTNPSKCSLCTDYGTAKELHRNK